MTLEIADIIVRMAKTLSYHRIRLDQQDEVIRLLTHIYGLHPTIMGFIGRHYDTIVQEASKINADRGIRPHVG